MLNQSKQTMGGLQCQMMLLSQCRLIKLDSKVIKGTRLCGVYLLLLHPVGPLKTQIGKGAVSLNLTLRRYLQCVFLIRNAMFLFY